MFFCRLLILFSKSTFSKNSRASNSLDPDQVRHFVVPDLGPNCFQKLSADGTSRVSRSSVLYNDILHGKATVLIF